MAAGVIRSLHRLDVAQLVKACNDVLVNHRGVVLTIIKVDYNRQLIDYCNFGNIGFILYLPDGTTFEPIPARGYLSGKKQVIKSSTYRFYQGAVFLLYSDGLKRRPAKERLLRMTSPTVGLENLLEKENYAIDDVTILIGRFK
ncbi:SpoIIE family protein phosphatase [Halalkalibacter krulwichiae]|uniref:Stage II sporulation protein E (SpoIIE) n=2 Tax=Halalkalibacter krulwichiae TaxID=199441 RepID=A0A1X9M7N6_9BACI|nr:SpoIIE family protein phosphatase [Halalkalibacter krulwichiae]ARK28620.1 Stage II sporulation protein E (SpoIIE) [Halalkalibacter krulwichiae]